MKEGWSQPYFKLLVSDLLLRSKFQDDTLKKEGITENVAVHDFFIVVKVTKFEKINKKYSVKIKSTL